MEEKVRLLPYMGNIRRIYWRNLKKFMVDFRGK